MSDDDEDNDDDDDEEEDDEDSDMEIDEDSMAILRARMQEMQNSIVRPEEDEVAAVGGIKQEPGLAGGTIKPDPGAPGIIGAQAPAGGAAAPVDHLANHPLSFAAHERVLDAKAAF